MKPLESATLYLHYTSASFQKKVFEGRCVVISWDVLVIITKFICLYDFCLENKEHAQDLFGSTVGELEDLITEDNNELDFKIAAYELLQLKK